MASRVVLQDQQRGGEKQKIGQGEGKNRRVLKYIGNLVQAPGVDAEGKAKVTRPITRSFGAQLLAKAQKDVDENPKKPLAEGVNGVAVGKGVKAPALKKLDLCFAALVSVRRYSCCRPDYTTINLQLDNIYSVFASYIHVFLKKKDKQLPVEVDP